MPKKALIAMSGGVDSSVAAFLTQRDGYACMGVTMLLYENADAGDDEESVDVRAAFFRDSAGRNFALFGGGISKEQLLKAAEALIAAQK